MNDWRDINYLLQGNKKQQAAYHALLDVGVLNHLLDFDPILVGTIPIDIDIASSDLDIILYAKNYHQVAKIVHKHYRQYSDFLDHYRQDSYIASFFAQGFEFELFAQNKPVIEQNAYRHMLVEHRILHIAGDTTRQAIRDLKKDGLKTEPAFAQYFNLEGDPYQALLTLEKLDDDALKEGLNL
jgi:Domain of unknown function (DUF4269)